MAHDPLGEVRAWALDTDAFVRLTWRARTRRTADGAPTGGTGSAPAPVRPAWERVVVRPVLLRGVRHLQFSYSDGRRTVMKNRLGAEAVEEIDALLRRPFASLKVQSTTGTLVAQMTRRGRVILHRRIAAPGAAPAPELAHDRRKDLPLPVGRPDPFLQRLGVMDAEGRVRAAMHDKFAQINEFLRVLTHAGALHDLPRPVHLVDCGCGAALLAFAARHYLQDVLGIPTVLSGVDADPGRIARCTARVAELGLGEDEARFAATPIAAYAPDAPPHIVLALHACDTASDEALARAVEWGARLILCAPCCHHDLLGQLAAVPPFEPLLRHGILKRRLADALTDTFRALALQAAGYRTDVIEFVSSEHTDRNVMIRAVWRAGGAPSARAASARAVREYRELRAFWRVTPAIERLLGDPLARRLRG